MKKYINKETVSVFFGLLVIIALLIYANHLRSQIDYLDIECPVCGSAEVGNFGEDPLKPSLGTKGHCFDCGTEFYVEK